VGKKKKFAIDTAKDKTGEQNGKDSGGPAIGAGLRTSATEGTPVPP